MDNRADKCAIGPATDWVDCNLAQRGWIDFGAERGAAVE